ncbi:MAG: SDR family NAD(P)-dependent oxidoreductase [Planctomycetaceae bacterium]|jgi:short-subunit dehydrogenase|nr:SDR family NAD(P)-dependent oxidoreductase [Planctomycetaceae bacterium]
MSNDFNNQFSSNRNQFSVTDSRSVRSLAAITGASDGLGKEFAYQLAADGYDLLIIARRGEILEEIKKDIETKYGVFVEAYVCDLSNAAEVKQLEQRLETSESLEFMVNNAGFGRSGMFPDVDPDHEETMIRVHTISLMRLSRAALTPMCRRRKGFLINLASVAAFLYGNNTAEYIATKAYVLAFSKCIQCDVKKYGVRVQALCPGLTHTGFHSTESMKFFRKDKTPRILWLAAEYVVCISLRSIRKTRRVVCIPSLRYKLILALLCNPISNKISEIIYNKRVRNETTKDRVRPLE